MKKKNLYVLCLLFLCSCNVAGVGLLRMSKSVSKKQVYKEMVSRDIFIKSRNALVNQGKLDFINQESDTVYILETIDGESNVLLGMIFNDQDSIKYTYDNTSHRKGVSFVDHSRFSGKIISELKRNDSTVIKYSRIKEKTIHPPSRVYVSKVVFSKRKYVVVVSDFIFM